MLNHAQQFEKKSVIDITYCLVQKGQQQRKRVNIRYVSPF